MLKTNFWKLVGAIIVAQLILGLAGLLAYEATTHTRQPRTTTTFKPDR